MIKLYTKKEAASELRISVATLDRHVVSGKLQSTKIGRKRMFTEKYLEAFKKREEV